MIGRQISKQLPEVSQCSAKCCSNCQIVKCSKHWSAPSIHSI